MGQPETSATSECGQLRARDPQRTYEHHPLCDDNGWNHFGPCIIETPADLNGSLNGSFNQAPLFGAPQERPTTDDHYTPAWVFQHLGLNFDLDVCAPPDGIPWIPADRYFTKADDGLSQPWRGRVWMNPPYSECTPWVQRFMAHEAPAVLQAPPAAADAREVELVEMRAAEVEQGHVLSSAGEVLDARWRNGLRVLEVDGGRRLILDPDHMLQVRS